MSDQTSQSTTDKKQDHEGNSFVSIKVNGEPVSIHRGSQTGADIKKACNCPSSFLLKRVPGLELINNDDRVTIKGGEEFVCHAPIGQAS